MGRYWDAIRTCEKYSTDPNLTRMPDALGAHGAPVINLNGEPIQAISETDGAFCCESRNEESSSSQLPKTAATSIISLAGNSVQIGPNAEVPVHSEPESVWADRFRFLRTRLRNLWNAGKLKTLLITSPFPHDGKSTVAINLAVILAERGKRKVLLIEADCHYPVVVRRLGLDDRNLTGLADCVEGNADPFSAILWVDPIGIYVLPAGKPRIHPSELLQTDALSGMIESYREHFDWVLIDSPPVKPLSDALLLRQRTDATLLVIRAGHTDSSAVDEAISLLGKRNIIGMVLNGVEGLERTYSHYYGSYGNSNKSKK